MQSRPKWVRYSAALLICAVLVALKFVLHDISPGHARVLLMGVALSAYWGGIGPGLMATVIGAITNTFLFMPTDSEFNDHVVEVVSFLSVSAIVISLIHTLSKATNRARTLAEQRALFLANVSHEIRTPMNTIVGMTDLLSHNSLTSQQRESVQLIRRSTESLIRLVSDLLDFTKFSFSKNSLRPSQHHIQTRLEELFSSFRKSTQDLGLTLDLTMDPALSPIATLDWERFRQVVSNLLENAMKFSPPGTKIDVTVYRPAPDVLRFEVRDTGPGIPKSEQSRIFEAFVQLDSGPERKFGGTGLGLAISKQIIEAMDGQIGVDSQPGQGSRFWFEIPCPATDLVFQPGFNIGTELYPQLLGCKVLLAEDHAVNRRMIERLLGTLGIETKSVESGNRALELAAAEHFDLAILDCHMPGLDGYKTGRILREQHPTLPVVALTADGSNESLKACERAGFAEVLLKPVGIDTLKRMLARRIPATSHEEFQRRYLANLKKIEARSGKAFLEDLSRSFLNSTPSNISAIQQGIETKDFARVRERAHSLKSASAAIGARALTQIAVRIEKAPEETPIESFRALQSELQAEFARAEARLKGEFGPDLSDFTSNA